MQSLRMLADIQNFLAGATSVAATHPPEQLQTSGTSISKAGEGHAADAVPHPNISLADWNFKSHGNAENVDPSKYRSKIRTPAPCLLPIFHTAGIRLSCRHCVIMLHAFSWLTVASADETGAKHAALRANSASGTGVPDGQTAQHAWQQSNLPPGCI